MALNIQYITDQEGKPVSVILPIKEFKELVEIYGIDISQEEIEAIEKGKLLRSGNLKVLEEEYADLDSI